MDNTDQLEEVVNSITVDSAGQFYTLDELIEKLGIKRESKPGWLRKKRRWYKFLPNFLEKRANKHGLHGIFLFLIGCISGFSGIAAILIMIFLDIFSTMSRTANTTLSMILVLSALFMAFSLIFYDGIVDKSKKLEELSKSEKKKELIYEHCQSMIEDYRNQVMDEDSEMVKTEARLKKDIEKVDSVIKKIESFLKDHQIKVTDAEEKDIQRQLSDAERLKKGREKILKAHSDTKEKFLKYLTSLEKKLARVDISISLKRVADELNDLEDKTASRISESEQAFMELLTSFAGDIQNLQNAIENLQVFSRASFEVENDSGEPRVLMSKEEEMIDINTFMKNAVSENKVLESVPAS